MALRSTYATAVTLSLLGVGFCAAAGCTFLVQFDDGMADGGSGVSRLDGGHLGGAVQEDATLGGEGTSEAGTGVSPDDDSGDTEGRDGGGEVGTDSATMIDAGPTIDCSNACEGYSSFEFWSCADKHPGWCVGDGSASEIALCDFGSPQSAKSCPASQPCSSGGESYSDFCNPCSDPNADRCISNGNPSSFPKTDLLVVCDGGAPVQLTVCTADTRCAFGCQ